MNKRRFYVVSAVVAIAILALLAASYAFSTINAQPTPPYQIFADALKGTRTPTPPVTFASAVKTSEAAVANNQPRPTTQITGGPAIVPTIPNAPADKPAFTEQDVRDFALKNSTRGFFKIQAKGPDAQIASIEFATLSALEKELNITLEGLGGPNTLLCMVRYNGPFVISEPFSPTPGAEIHYAQAVQIFDAHTGNFMMATALNAP